MKQIRNGVFETNSSSEHSIVVLKKGGPYDFDNIHSTGYFHRDEESGTIDFGHSECEFDFGRSPFEVLSDFVSKIRYVIAAYCGSGADPETAKKNLDMIVGICQKVIPECTAIELPEDFRPYYVDPETGEEVCGSEILHEKTSEDEISSYYIDDNYDKKPVEYHEEYTTYYGWIDHQSEGVLQAFLAENNITLEDFLLDRKYVIIVDGDEYQLWKDMQDLGLINPESIEKEYPLGISGRITAFDHYQYQKEHPEDFVDEEGDTDPE